MKNFILSSLLILLVTPALANEIYITQVGDGLDLDITQDGTGNDFGDSTTDVILNGDDMTFAITQTGCQQTPSGSTQTSSIHKTTKTTETTSSTNRHCAIVRFSGQTNQQCPALCYPGPPHPGPREHHRHSN